MKAVRYLAAVMAAFFVMAGASGAYAAKGLFIQWRGETACDQGLRDGLREAEVKCDIEVFNADRSKEALAAFLDKLDPSAYDFIYTFGTTASLMTADKVTTTPVVFGIVTNPVKSGLINDWSFPGRNVMGVSHAIPYSDQISFILRLGSFDKIGMIYNPEEENSKIARAELEAGLLKRGLSFIPVQAAGEGGIEAALEKLAAEKVGLVYLPSDSFVVANAARILSGLNARKIPTYGALEKLVQNGAMIGIVSSYYQVGKNLADKVEAILKGAKASDIPSNILPLDQQTILLNARTAEAVGIDLPYEVVGSAQVVE